MAVRAGEDLLLSSLLPLTNPFLHVVELGYVAHFLYTMGLLRRHGECPIGDVPPCSDRGGCQANARVAVALNVPLQPRRATPALDLIKSERHF